MKFLFVSTLACLALSSLAQTDNRILFSQLMVVFSDIDKDFDYLKGDLKTKEGNISIFETNRSLEGTTDNVIISDSVHYQYLAVISDSTSEEGSQLLLNAWKEKFTDMLTGMFSPATEFKPYDDPNTNGYQFSSDHTVLLLLRHREDHLYWVNIVIRSKSK